VVDRMAMSTTGKTFRYDVFLSHSSKDKRKAEKLATRLRADGISVWFDRWVIKPGDDIFTQIERGLEESGTLLLLLSSNALKSDWVTMERNTALFRNPANRRQRRVIPVLIDDCRDQLPDTLRRYAFVDMRRITRAAYQDLLSVCRSGSHQAAEKRARPTKRPSRSRGPSGHLRQRSRRLPSRTARARRPKGDLQALGRQVATDICREAGRRQYALTAVTAAVQDRLGEDIVLVPRAKRFDRAVVYSANFAWHGRLIPRHIVCYHIPSRPAPERLPERLLRVVLDIAHELGHLILEEGPGRCRRD